MAVRVVTDSASSISDAGRSRLGLTVVPLPISEGGRAISEDELAAPGFYERLAAMPAPPTTSQPTPEAFATAFRALAGDGHDVLAVLISGDMSGTVASAEAAADEVRTDEGSRVEVLDSRSNSLEEGFAVLSAAEAAHAGAGIAECRRLAEETMRRTRFLFTPHSLEYLRRGGRISRAGALAGVVLKIAPVLTAENGSTGIAGVARSVRAARAKIASLMRTDVERHGLRRAAVQYAADADEANRFAAEVIEPIVGDAVPVVPIHPVVGLHVGPAVGVVYETEQPLR